MDRKVILILGGIVGLLLLGGGIAAIVIFVIIPLSEPLETISSPANPSTDNPSPENFPDECSQDVVLSIIMCSTTRMNSTWDIKSTFDKVAESVNDDSFVLEYLWLQGNYLTYAQTVPAQSISSLNIKTIKEFVINGGNKFSSIHSDAFPSIYNTVEGVYAYDMDWNSGEAFELFNKFSVTKSLYLFTGNTLTEIPQNAFSSTPAALQSIGMENVGLRSIGNLAFSALPNISYVNLDGNDIPEEGISNSALQFSSPSTMLFLTRNTALTHLPQEKFESFFQNGHSLYVGTGTIVDSSYPLDCDYRMDWFCDGRYFLLFGYFCKQQEFVDIWDYCYRMQTVGSNVFSDKENIEKRIKTASDVESQMEHYRAQKKRHETIMRQLKPKTNMLASLNVSPII